MLEGNLTLIIFYLIYLIAIFTVGALVLKIFRLDFENKIERKIYEFGLGNLVYSYLFIYLGIFHLLYKPVLLLFYVFPSIFLIPRLFALKIKNVFSWRKLSGEALLIFLLFSFILFPLVPHLFLFPSSWDALAYHLMLPKFYLQKHFFPFVDWFRQTTFPVGIEALFGYGELVRDPRIGNLIVFSFILATMYFLLYGLRYLFSKGVSILAAFLFLFQPILYTETSVAPFVDFPLALYGLLSFATLIKFLKSPSVNLLALLISLAFFTIMIKYSGILLLVSLFLALFIWAISNPQKFKGMFEVKSSLKVFWVTLALVVLPVFYWLTRNYINAGNPIFPFLNNIFKGLDYDEASYKSSMAALKDTLFSFESLSRFVRLRGDFDRPEDYLNLFKFLFFANLASFSLVGLFRKEQFLKYCSLGGLFFVTLVNLIAGFPTERFSLPAVPILLVVSSFIFFDLFKGFKWGRLLLAGFFIITMFVQIDSAFLQREKFYLAIPKRSLFGSLSYQIAKKRLNLQDNYPAISFANKNLDPQKDKILTVFDNRLYYFNIPVIFALPSQKGLFINPETKTEEEIFWKVKETGITYVFVNNNWGIPENLRKDVYYPFVEKYLEPVFSASGTVLYRVK